MAAEDQGIMSLPMEGEATSQNMPQMPLEESYDAVQQGLQNASPQAAADVQQLMASIMPQLDQLSDEELDTLLQMVQYLYEGGEEQYAKRLQEAISSGAIDAGDLPDEYDPEVLSSIGTVLLQAVRQRQGGMQAEQGPMPPAQFARGGIAEAARMVASKGRYGDTMLAHITPEEARLLKKRGGSGSINPETGLPEFFLKKLFQGVKQVFKSVAKAVKSIVKSPIGKILSTVALATFLGPLGAFALPVASGTVTLASGGSLKDALISGATAYFGAPGGAVSQYIGAAGITNVAANAAITAGIVGTGAGLLTGQKLQDAVKAGLTAGAISGISTGVQQGFTTGNAPRTDLPLVEDRGDMLRTTTGDQFVPASAGQGAPLTPRAVASGTAAAVPEFRNEYGDLYTPDATIRARLAGAAQAPTSAAAPGAAPAAAAPPTTGPLQTPPGAPIESFGQAPTVMESLTKTAGGIGDLFQGKPGAFDTIKQGASDLFMPKTYTAAELQNSDVFTTARGAGATYEQALKRAQEAYNPGIVRQYGPMVGAGLGVAGLMGGFTPKQPAPSALAQQMRGTPGLDLINRSPRDYLVQGLPGLQYSPEGNIIGSTPYRPSATMADVRVAASDMGAAMTAPPIPRYVPDPRAMGTARDINQPGNTAAMYSNLMPNMGYNPYDPYGYFAAADGGLASLASGGYPRKTGAISGPGTEKSDSIPAMLSDGEFVMTAKAVRGIGGGSRRAGAKKMYALMHQLERNASRG